MNSPMNSAVRKIHNLLSSGAVTVTGPNQPRILKHKTSPNTIINSNANQQVSANRCYVCDDALAVGQAQNSITEMQTPHTSTKFPNKIGHLVGEAFTVIISADDVVCARCTNLINYLDRLENDVERVRTNLINLLHKKYGLNDDGGGDVSPAKMQKLNSGTTVMRLNTDETVIDSNRTRKIVQMVDSVLGKQSPPVSAVQQIKISTQPTQLQSPHHPQQQHQQLTTAGTQTIQRKTTRIYKCLTCEYKTSDMRLFNTHYETCKQQNFQCKNCKKIFPNFGTMKQHMVREHSTSMDNTCSVCHINFVSEGALRKHMELNHSTNVVVTTTVPMSTVVNEVTGTAITTATGNIAASSPSSTAFYTCSHCQFKTTDKTIYDDHLRKHLSTGKPKPFKCRLCSQRFETREAATIHAKQHQPNYFKCGTCSMSFSKREQLVKHFEVHQQQNATGTSSVTTQQQQHNVQHITLTSTAKQLSSQSPTAQSANLLTTQKLLQETIDEALSDTVTATPTTASTTDTTSATASNIRFYSCHVCSLTFLQENYYNQHMETHRRDEKKSSTGGVVSNASSGNAGHLNAISNNASNALGVNAGSGVTIKKNDSSVTNAQQADANSAAEADIESIFEKMHSDKSDVDTATSASVSVSTAKSSLADKAGKMGSNGERKENLVITSQEGSGGITFNITIPEATGSGEDNADNSNKKSTVSIDMPTLDQPDENLQLAAGSSGKAEVKDDAADDGNGQTTKTAAAPVVSMPSLDDDGEPSEHHQAAESGKTADDGSSPDDSKKPSEKVKDSAKTEGDIEKDVSSGGNVALSSNQEEGDKSGEAAVHGGESDVVGVAAGNESVEGAEGLTAEQLAAAAGEHQQVAMELDEAMQAQVESGQIKFILNENGQILQLDNHIITDAEGNQILVQDPEQIQQLLQSVGVLQSGDAIDGETLQMMTDNGQMVLVHGENNETQLIDASLLNAEGQIVIQQGQDGELGEGTHVISEDGTRIPVSVSYTADGQPIVQVQQVLSATSAGEETALEKDVAAATGEANSSGQGDAADSTTVATTQASGSTAGSGFFSLEDLMQQQQQHTTETKAAD